MAVSEEQLQHDHDEFVAAVARNIQTLLANRRLFRKDLAEALGVDPGGITKRMKGKTAWGAFELHRVAAVLGVSYDTVTARTERDFREAWVQSMYLSSVPLTSTSDEQSFDDINWRLEWQRPELAAVAGL